MVKVNKKGLIVLPAELRRKYGIREGSEVILVDEGDHVTLIPRRGLEELYGMAEGHRAVIGEMIRELHGERRVEARSRHMGSCAHTQR